MQAIKESFIFDQLFKQSRRLFVILKVVSHLIMQPSNEKGSLSSWSIAYSWFGIQAKKKIFSHLIRKPSFLVSD